mgnify:CR=1 FL=1
MDIVARGFHGKWIKVKRFQKVFLKAGFPKNDQKFDNKINHEVQSGSHMRTFFHYFFGEVVT